MSDETENIVRLIEQSETSNFLELVKIAGLDPAKDFRWLNFNGVDLSNCDLSGYDFRGALIDDADFTNTNISGAIFDNEQAELASLRTAADYNAFVVKKISVRKLKEPSYKTTKIHEIMHKGHSIPSVNMMESVKDAVLEISSKGFGFTGVVDDENKLVGIITDGDLRRHLASNLLDLNVNEIMTRNPKTISPDATVLMGLLDLNAYRITALPITVNEEIHGFVTIHDLLRFSSRELTQ